MTKRTFQITRYVLTAPRFLGWLFPLLAVATFCAKDLKLLDDAVLVATWRPWVVARWRYSMAFSAGLVLHPARSAESFERTLAHERVHVRQTEDGALLGLALGLACTLIEMNPVWMVLWPLLMFGKLFGWLGAVLRGGHVYRDAEHERSAYAQTDTRRDGSSWLSDHESKIQGW